MFGEEKMCKHCGRKADFFVGDRVQVIPHEAAKSLDELSKGEFGTVNKNIAEREGTIVEWGFHEMDIVGGAMVLLDGNDKPFPIWARHLRKAQPDKKQRKITEWMG